jgi:16S rRNA (cytosine1402-N4)-methyltransferase
MQQEARDCICPPGLPSCVCGHTANLRLINKKVIIPSPEEVHKNPRSRSARLRAAERVVTQDEHYKLLERLCSSKEAEINGWRRPALLKKLRQAFLAV